jgi:hypothetical protein
MAADIHAHLICRLQMFERSIATTDEHFDRLEPMGTYRASDPYVEKSVIEALFRIRPADFQQNGDLVTEYNRISNKLVEFERERGAGLRDKLLGELRHYLDSYHAGVCCMQLGIMNRGAVSDLARRDIIDILLGELHGSFDLGDTEEMLTGLDAACQSMIERDEGIPDKESVASCPECDSTTCRGCDREKIPEE